jgi:hypothetical protein
VSVASVLDDVRRRWLVPCGASLAVLVTLVGPWWLVRPGPPVARDHAVSLPAPGRTPLAWPTGAPTMPGPQGVRLESYRPAAHNRLSIAYTIGVSQCFGAIQPPVVVEDAHTVTVTLTQAPVRRQKHNACPDLALMESVDVTLRHPLGNRLVLDGAGGSVVQPGPKVGQATGAGS